MMRPAAVAIRSQIVALIVYALRRRASATASASGTLTFEEFIVRHSSPRALSRFQ
jgi:hypothetical protein